MNNLHRSLCGDWQIITKPTTSVSTITLGLFIPIGAIHDPPDQRGLVHLAEHVFYQTAFQNAPFADLLKQVGSISNAYTTKEYSVFYIKALPEYANEALQWLLAIPTITKFSQEVFLSEKESLLLELHALEKDPWEVLQQRFYHCCLPKHRMTNPVGGTTHDIRSLQYSESLSHYQNHYPPSHLTLCVTGAIEPEQILPIVSKSHYKTINSKPSLIFPEPVYVPTVENTFEESEYFLLGFPSSSIHSNDYWPMLLWECFLHQVLEAQLPKLPMGSTSETVLMHNAHYQNNGCLCFGFMSENGKVLYHYLQTLWQTVSSQLTEATLALLKKRVEFFLLNSLEISEHYIEQLYLWNRNTEIPIDSSDITEQIRSVSLKTMQLAFDKLDWSNHSFLSL